MPDYYLRRYVFPDAEHPSSEEEPGRGGVSARGSFSPPVDICETEQAYELRMEIAGVDPGTVEILAGEDARTLTISGLRHASSTARRGKFLNLEIQYGHFARRIMLPESVDRDAAKASYVDGFLVIELPKQPNAGKRRVPISDGT